MIHDTAIPVIFAANPPYYQHLCVTIVSILENNRSHEFDFYVLTDDDRSEEIEKLLRLKEQYTNFRIQFKRIKTDDVSDFNSCITYQHVSIQTYYRCIAPNLFSDVSKAIYLDCDLVVEGDLHELWNTDIDDYHIAGVDTSCFFYMKPLKQKIGLMESDVYINAGVLLMNFDAMRNDRAVEKMGRSVIELGDRISMGDQDVLNYSLRGKIKTLDRKFNWNHEMDDEFKNDSCRNGGAVVSHFSGRAKPWSIDWICRHSASKRYFHYLAKTPYRDYIAYYKANRRRKWIFLYLNEFVRNFVKLFLTKRQIERIRMKYLPR